MQLPEIRDLPELVRQKRERLGIGGETLSVNLGWGKNTIYAFEKHRRDISYSKVVVLVEWLEGINNGPMEYKQ